MANKKKDSKKHRIKGAYGQAGAGKSVMLDTVLAAKYNAMDAEASRTFANAFIISNIKPRTKREQAIAAQEYQRGRSEGYQRGHDEGARRGAEAERRHGEELLCRVVAAAKS